MCVAPLLAPARPSFPSFAHAPTPAARSCCPAPRARAALPHAARPRALAPPFLALPGHTRPRRPATLTRAALPSAAWARAPAPPCLAPPGTAHLRRPAKREGDTAAAWSVRGVVRVRRRNKRIRFRVWGHVYISFISWAVGQGGLAGFGSTGIDNFGFSVRLILKIEPEPDDRTSGKPKPKPNRKTRKTDISVRFGSVRLFR